MKKAKKIEEIGHFKKWFLITAGTISVFIGIIGVVIPLLPTTPFLLLAAACYVRSSEKMYDRLMANRFLGAYIRDYREGRGMTKANKIGTLILLWAAIGYSAIYAVEMLWLKILLFSIAIGVTIHILKLKTTKHPKSKRLSEHT